MKKPIQKILLLDNYDSFTYNLFHSINKTPNISVDVIQNDEIDSDTLVNYDKIILSPGPGLPKDSGKLMEVIDLMHKQTPILGVCLGMQALTEYFGGSLKNLEAIYHGKPSNLMEVEKEDLIYKGVHQFQVGRYHSWGVLQLPQQLKATSRLKDGLCMSFKHISLPIWGVQFHPESILTPDGDKMIQNFIEYTR